MLTSPHPPMGADHVNYVGEPYAVVIADNARLAKTAAEQVVAEFNELPAVVDLASAVTADPIFDNIPSNRAYDWALGDKVATDAAFADAAHVTEISLSNNRLIPNAMEPRSAVALFDAGTGDYTLYTTCLLYTSPSPRDQRGSRMPSSA